MAYADVDYYKNTYGGAAIPDEQLPRYLSQASDDIDAMTFCRVGGAAGFAALPAYTQSQVQKAVCAQADYRHDYGDMIDVGLSGYHVGDVTVNIESAGIGPYSPVARRLLLPTGLMYPGV